MPKFFPANVNRGIVSYNDQKPGANKTYNFGSAYTDDSGFSRGSSASPTSLMGPLNTGTGLPVGGPATNLNTYPAGGYVSHVQMTVQRPPTPGRGGTTRNNNPPIYDVTESGICVPPNVNLTVQQETLDFGKEPGGTGYSPLTGNANNFRANDFAYPFSPTGLKDWPIGTPSPWDDPTQFGSFFLPFTVTSASNINLVDVRIAKLYGEPNAGIDARSLTLDLNNVLLDSGVAVATGLTSQDINSLLLPPLPSIAFGRNGSNANGPGLGNIGIVSSFDHGLINPSVDMLYTSERSLYPIVNPAVDGNAATQASTLNGNNFLLDAWTQNYQPRPTIHKPLPGTTAGTNATVPDVPRTALGQLTLNGNSFAAPLPKIGIAIPYGTPVGTYTGTIYPYEDNIPFQWREWLSRTQPNPPLGNPHAYDYDDQDGILSENAAAGPLEPVASSGLSLRVTVKENKLTNGTTRGSLAQMDAVTIPSASQSSTAPYNQGKSELVSPIPLGLNLQPAVLPITTLDQNEQIFLYWTTNRQTGTQYTQSVTTRDSTSNNVLTANVPIADAPINLAYDFLNTPYATYTAPDGSVQNRGDVQFFLPTTGTGFPNSANGQYWQTPQLISGGTGYFTGVPGTVVPNTVRLGSPNPALAYHVAAGANATPIPDTEAYLVWFGQADKKQNLNGVLQQATESRTFYTGLTAGVPSGGIQSFLNDAAVTKLGPKPLLAKFEADNRNGTALQPLKMLYIFWYAGGNAKTSIYYNANVTGLTGTFSVNGWDANATQLGDQQLPIPNVLTWESDPHPVLRRVTAHDPFAASPGTYRTFDAIDVYYTGVLRNRQKVEVLMSRYGINRGEYSNMKLGQLFLLDLPQVTNELMGHTGTGNSYTTRDAGWNTVDPIKVAIYNGNNGNGNITNGAVLLDTTTPQQPLSDPASGLLYANLTTGSSVSGGKMVIDTQSGAVTFPNIAPKPTDSIYVTYTPLVMRLNTSRGGSNSIDIGIVQSAIDINAPNDTAVGDNSQPTVIFDRAPNPMWRLTNPYVLQPIAKNINQAPPIDRLWVLYHKTDLSTKFASNVYYKALRLMARLPLPVALTNTGGTLGYNITVTGAVGPYEVDWSRGRIYFTQVDEGNTVNIQYTGWNNTTKSVVPSINRNYEIAWGDEISVTGTPDQTTQESVLPTDQGVNEGQITAFKDPLIDKLWVFWSSTRGGVPDIYTETLAPQFYQTVSNQQ